MCSGVQPLSRELEKPYIDPVKSKLFKVKSAREIFSAKNFKTPKYLIKRDKVPKMPDLDLELYQPNDQVNKMELNDFKV